MVSSLTAKQAEILRIIEEETAQSGRPPSYREIAKRCGYDAVGTVQDHVRALIRKGFLTQVRGVARGIQLAHRSESRDIPILGSVPAGRPIEAIHDATGSVSISGSLKGDFYALRVKGESMIEAGILDGDLVIVRQQATADSGDIVVAMIEGEATVKKLERKAGRVRLLPANPLFSPIEIPPGSENSIQGKVVALQRLFT